MGKASKHKKRKGQPAPSSGVSPELAARLSQGLTKKELADPELMRQIATAFQGSFPGVYTFSDSAPSATPPSELPELESAEKEEAQAGLQGGTVPLRPSQVIDLHARMYEGLARPERIWTQYMEGFMGDALRRGVESEQDAYEKWGVMFQPAVTPEQYCTILARQLSAARTYQVTSQLTDVVTAVYEKTASQVSSFQSEDVPWPAGFVYLDKPVTLLDRHGKPVMNRALSWNLELSRFEGDKKDAPLRPAVRIVCWSWWDDRDDYWTPETGQVMREMGGLSLAHSVIMPFGVEYRTLAERRAEGAPGDDISRWLHALWLVMESEVPAMRRAADIERHVHARALRSLNHADVTVVLLRRTASKGLDEGDPGHRYVDWTHRWVVQGFWRHYHKQAHHAAPDQTRESCLVCGTRISWVRPHLRGPSDKPLKASPQLYRLAR